MYRDLEDISIFHIYHLQSQFEPHLIYSKAILSVLMQSSWKKGIISGDKTLLIGGIFGELGGHLPRVFMLKRPCFRGQSESLYVSFHVENFLT